MIGKRRTFGKASLVPAILLIISKTGAFVVGPSVHRISRRLNIPAPPMASLNKDTSPISEKPDKEKGSSDKPSRQSVLYYDKSSQYKQEKKQKKEKALRDRQIAVYHNKLEKNANDCSVCTVPDVIDASKISTPKEDQSNGVTPVQTVPESLLEIKKQVNQLVHEPSVELVELVLILASSLCVALTTVHILPPMLSKMVYFCQDATLYIFTFGFLSRWLSSLEPRGTYFEDPLEWVDFAVVVLPFLFLTVPGMADLFPPWMTSQISLINLRLLRVLRFQRILQDETTFSRFVGGLRFPGQKEDALGSAIVEPWQLQLARVLLSIFTLVSVSTGLIYAAEHKVNPGMDDYFSALYFGLTTLTTVGFGDVTPITWQGKLVVSGSILAGVAVVPAQAAALVEALLAKDAETKPDNLPSSLNARPPPPPPPASMGKNLVLETTQACPSCKAGLHWAQANFCYNCGHEMSIEL